MKKLVLASMLALTAGSALAESDGWYGSWSYDNKRFQGNNSSVVGTGQFNKNVFGQTIGKKLGDGWSAEILTEAEQKVVNDTQSGNTNEWLLQARVLKDFDTGTIFTPYVGLALGQKSKDDANSRDFAIYRYDLGTKVKIDDMFGIRLGYRHRQAFSSTSHAVGVTKYDTDEYTAALSVKFTPKDTVSFAYKIERNADGNLSKDFNTFGISYGRAFSSCVTMSRNK